MWVLRPDDLDCVGPSFIGMRHQRAPEAAQWVGPVSNTADARAVCAWHTKFTQSGCRSGRLRP